MSVLWFTAVEKFLLNEVIYTGCCTYYTSVIFAILFFLCQSSQVSRFEMFGAIVYILQWFIPGYDFTLLREINSDIYY